MADRGRLDFCFDDCFRSAGRQKQKRYGKAHGIAEKSAIVQLFISVGRPLNSWLLCSLPPAQNMFVGVHFFVFARSFCVRPRRTIFLCPVRQKRRGRSRCVLVCLCACLHGWAASLGTAEGDETATLRFEVVTVTITVASAMRASQPEDA